MLNADCVVPTNILSVLIKKKYEEEEEEKKSGIYLTLFGILFIGFFFGMVCGRQIHKKLCFSLSFSIP